MSLLFVASERPKYKDAAGAYLGAHGRLLDRMLGAAGLTRSDCQVVFADEYRHGMAAEHSVVVLGGADAARAAFGFPAPPSYWHGSVLPTMPQLPNSYDAYRSWLKEPPKFVVTYDIPTLHNAWDLHPLAARDWQKAGQVHRGEYRQPNPDWWEWVINEPKRLAELSHSPTLVFDTELSPVWMIGFANDRQVHVCDWDWEAAPRSQTLLQSRSTVKVAHNLQHDLAMCELRFGFKVTPPYFDTYGGCHLLNTALERTLSPGLSARFTNWPYHKWMMEHDAPRYNGLDNIVCYEGYQEIQRQLAERKLTEVAAHDHKLLGALFGMQMTGFRVSEAERAKYEEDTAEELALAEEECRRQAAPIIQERLHRFEKPGLFYVKKQCQCCGGGSKTRAHCWRCYGFPAKPTRKADYFQKPHGLDDQHRKLPVAKLSEMLCPCATCGATGKVGEWQEFNPSSGDQVADVLYRGLGIRARKYKGKETVAAAQLKPLGDKYPLVKTLVEASVLRADLKTVERLTPGPDGRLHCVFDPWGTESGRVAGKEGLLQPGTNPMNVPKKARRFVVPDPGYFFLYPDLSQVEARAVAVLSGDAGLLRAFTEPVNWPGHAKHGVIDSHTVVQQMVSRWVEITRDQAKRLTYAAMYGVSPEQLAVELTAESMRKGGGVVSVAQAAAILEAFFMAFPGVRRWHKAIEDELMQTRTLKSLTGRERHWPGRIVDPKTGGITREILKQAWAFKPQDIGATILAKGIIDITEQHADLLTPLIHVHDACLMQAPLSRKDEAIRVGTAALSREMFGMWFPSEMKVGANWYEAS